MPRGACRVASQYLLDPRPGRTALMSQHGLRPPSLTFSGLQRIGGKWARCPNRMSPENSASQGSDLHGSRCHLHFLMQWNRVRRPRACPDLFDQARMCSGPQYLAPPHQSAWDTGSRQNPSSGVGLRVPFCDQLVRPRGGRKVGHEHASEKVPAAMSPVLRIRLPRPLRCVSSWMNGWPQPHGKTCILLSCPAPAGHICSRSQIASLGGAAGPKSASELHSSRSGSSLPHSRGSGLAIVRSSAAKAVMTAMCLCSCAPW